jgi:hypothetical protein
MHHQVQGLTDFRFGVVEFTGQLGFFSGDGVFVDDAFRDQLIQFFLGVPVFFFEGFDIGWLFGDVEEFFNLGFDGAFAGAVARASFGILPDSFFRR